MTLITEVINFDSPTVTGVQTINLTQFSGVTPKAIFLVGSACTAAGITGKSVMGYGMATSTTQRAAISIVDDDNRDNINVESSISNIQCVNIRDTTSIPNIVWVADLDSFNSGNFKLNWTTVQATAVKFTALVIGGTDITNAAVVQKTMSTTTGSNAVTGVGFQADGAIIITIDHTSTGELSNIQALGTSVSLWGATKQGTVSLACDDGHMSNTGRYRAWSTSAMHGLIDTGGTTNYLASLTSWDSDGYTLNWSDAAPAANVYYGLFLKGANIETGNSTLPTTPGTQAINVGFGSQIAIFASTGGTAAAATGENYTVASIGMSDGTVAGAHGISADFTDPSNTRRNYNATKIASILSHSADTEETIGNVSSFANPNVTINFTTVSGNADNYIVWAIKSSAPATKLPAPVHINQSVMHASTY